MTTGLIYKGKKHPFIFKNENLSVKQACFHDDVVWLPDCDAEFLMSANPCMFHYVGTKEPPVESAPAKVPLDEAIRQELKDIINDINTPKLEDVQPIESDTDPIKKYKRYIYIMTRSELIDFAKDVCEIDFPEEITKEKIMAALKEHCLSKKPEIAEKEIWLSETYERMHAGDFC